MKKYINVILCFILAVFIGYSFPDNTKDIEGKPMLGINYRLLGLGQSLETGVSCFTDIIKVRPAIYYMLDLYNLLGSEIDWDYHYYSNYDKKYSNNKFGLMVNYDVIEKKFYIGFFIGYRKLKLED